MSFEVDKFMQNPSPDWIKEAKKNDLLEIGKKLELEVKPSMRKQAILNEIVQYYIDEEVFPEEAATLVKPVSSDYYQELELRKLQLQDAQEKSLKRNNYSLRRKKKKEDCSPRKNSYFLRRKKKKEDYRLKMKKKKEDYSMRKNKRRERLKKENNRENMI